MDVSTAPRWHKSTHSDSTSCVEVAENLPGRVLVRDTKDRDGRPVGRTLAVACRAAPRPELSDYLRRIRPTRR